MVSELADVVKWQSLRLNGIPMRNMTKLVLQWLRCSNDLWVRHFASRDDGLEEFAAIEASLFTIMVGPALENKNWSLGEFIGCLQVGFLYGVAGERQLCVRQRSGTLYCNPAKVSIKAGDRYRVNAIDCAGTMLNNKAYVEVSFGGGFILEDPFNLMFLVEDICGQTPNI